MATKSPCKGCSASVQVSDDQIESMIAKIARFPEACVDDALYERRLAACSACPSLQYGTTCAHCGCIVRVRAKLKANGCPSPGADRWAIAD